MGDILGEKYAVPVLLFLLEKGTIKKSDLMEIAPAHQTIDKLLNNLEEQGFVKVERQTLGRKVYFVSLTKRGLELAEHLKEAVIQRPQEKVEEEHIHILTQEVLKQFQEARRRMSLLIHVNVKDDHISILERNWNGSGKDRIANIYIRVKPKNVLEFWCDLCESDRCYHIEVSKTYPEVQELIFRRGLEIGREESRKEMLEILSKKPSKKDQKNE